MLETLKTAALAAQSAVPSTATFWKQTLAHDLRRFDKGGDAFYDQISALHKSVRGSNPDAALYWFVRMLDGGADPLYLARRIIRMATEDIGLADPRALRIALDAWETYERLGSPGRRTGAGRSGALHGRGAEVERRLRRLQCGPRASSARTSRGRCRSTCAMRRPS